MRNAVLQKQERRTESERRTVLRIAVRQLERADLYLAAVCAIDALRDDLEDLRHQLIDARTRLAG